MQDPLDEILNCLPIKWVPWEEGWMKYRESHLDNDRKIYGGKLVDIVGPIKQLLVDEYMMDVHVPSIDLTQMGGLVRFSGFEVGNDVGWNEWMVRCLDFQFYCTFDLSRSNNIRGTPQI